MVPKKMVNYRAVGENNKWAGISTAMTVVDQQFSHFLDVTRTSFGPISKAITIFTSDHGDGHFAKYSCYEDGLRVPFMLQHTGMDLDTNMRSLESLLTLEDVLPTLIDFAGGDVATGNFDGKSFAPLLKHEVAPNTPIHTYIYSQYTARGVRCAYNAYPIRSITNGRWKYIKNFNSEHRFQVAWNNMNDATGWDAIKMRYGITSSKGAGFTKWRQKS